MSNHTAPRIAQGMTVTYTSRSGQVYDAIVLQADDLYRALIHIPATGQTHAVSYAALEPRTGGVQGTPTPGVYAIRHTFPNGERIGEGWLTVPGRPLLVLTGDYATSEATAVKCRANNPTHTYTVEPY